MKHAEDDVELMEVLLVLATLDDDEGDKQHITIEDRDETVTTFHGNVHRKEDDASIFPSKATTANDHASKNIDDIFLVATAFPSKPMAGDAIIVSARKSKSTATNRVIRASKGDNKFRSPSTNNTAKIDNREIQKNNESEQDRQDAKNKKTLLPSKTKSHQRKHSLPSKHTRKEKKRKPRLFSIQPIL